MTPTLDPFQHEVLDFLDASSGRAIYADPVGARKTGTTLSWLNRAGVGRTLIVAPKTVHGHWAREAERFFPAADVWLDARTKEQRWADISDVAHESITPTIYITTYDSMKIDEDRLKAAKFGTVVFDEGHRLKGRRTAVALSANAVTLRPKHLIIVTGTPVLNHADELWQYLHMLNRKAYPSFDRWVREHFEVYDTTFHGKLPRAIRVVEEIKEGHEQILRWMLHDTMIQREIGELFPGAPWTVEPEHVVIDVELTPGERRAYDKLVKHQWADIEGTTVQTTNKLALTTRLRQLSSDWGTLDSSLDDGAKVVAAAELIGDLARRETIVAFTDYKATAQRLVARLTKLGLQARTWTGDDGSESHEAVLRDYASGLVDVIVGTIASLGEGVDGLQHRGSSVVMLDRSWVPALNEQAIGRRRRSGQRERVTVYHVMARNTIDTAVVEACLRKENVVELLHDRPLKDTIYGKGIAL